MSESFKDRIRKWRIAGGLRQKEAAAKIDVPVATWRNWENGKRTPNKLALAEIERRLNDAVRTIEDSAFAERGQQILNSAIARSMK